MATTKRMTDEQEGSLKNRENINHRTKVQETIWILLLAMFIILIWFYTGKDYEDETIPENIAVTDKQVGDIK